MRHLSRTANELIEGNYSNLGGPFTEGKVFQINVNALETTGLTKEQILQEYRDIFEGLGELGEPLHLEIDESVTPVQLPPRRVPEVSAKIPL